MKTLTISLADIEGVPFGSPETRTFADVEVRYTGPVALTDGTVIPQLVKSERLPNTGTVEFEVYASDDPQVATEYHGFAIVVEAEVRRTVGFRKKATFRRTVKVLDSMTSPVALGSLAPAEGLPAQWVSVAEILNEVGDSVATQLADPTSDAHAAILNQVGLVADDQVVTVVNDETSDAHAAIVAQAGQTMTTEINDTSSAAYAALVAEAGQITDPATAALVSDEGSQTNAALTDYLSPVVIDATQHGIVGDGTTNIASPLRDLIASVSTFGGGTILLPVGTYIAIGGIDGASNVTVRGVDRNGTIIQKSGSNTEWINTQGADNFRFENLTIDGNHGVTASGIILGAGDGCALDGVTVKNFDAFAVRSATTTTNALITRSSFDNCNLAVRVDGANDGLTLEDNVFRDWQDCAVYVSGDANVSTNDVTIKDNIVLPHKAGTPADKVRQPIRFHGDDTNHHTNVVIKGNTVTGLYTNHADTATPGTADMISIHRITGFEVSGNTVRGGGDVGFTIAQGCRDGRVFGNFAEDCDTVGICLGSAGATFGVYNIVVTGNSFRNNALDRADTGGQVIDRSVERAKGQILAVQADDCVIDGNVMHYDADHPRPTRYAITWRECTNTHIGAVGEGNKSTGHTAEYYADTPASTGMTTTAHAVLDANPPAGEDARFVIAGIPIIVGNAIPEGVVVAPRGALYLRTAGAAGDQIYYKNQSGNATGWTASSQPPGQNSTNLGDATHPINTSGKARGKCVYNNTDNVPLWASNSGATDPWFDAQGNAVITPA